jgi:hypothetical protein
MAEDRVYDCVSGNQKRPDPIRAVAAERSAYANSRGRCAFSAVGRTVGDMRQRKSSDRRRSRPGSGRPVKTVGFSEQPRYAQTSTNVKMRLDLIVIARTEAWPIFRKDFTVS